MILLLFLCLLFSAPAWSEPLGHVIVVGQDAEAAEDTLRDLGFEVDRAVKPGSVLVGLGREGSAFLAQPRPELAGAVLLEPTEKPNSTIPVLVIGPDAETRGSLKDLTVTDSATQKAVRRFIIAHSRLPVQGLKGVPFVASPNWGVRPAETGIDTVVVHATVINTMEGTQRAFLDDKVRRVSAHYVIDRDGTIVQMVDERLTAWHAGVSELAGKTGVNDFSLGIELINLNDGVDPYPPAQVAALVRVIQDLRTRWDVPDERIVSHEFIARPVGRKSDPKGFDFPALFRLLNP